MPHVNDSIAVIVSYDGESATLRQNNHKLKRKPFSRSQLISLMIALFKDNPVHPGDKFTLTIVPKEITK